MEESPGTKLSQTEKKLGPCGALWSILSHTIHTNLAAAVLSLGALGPSGLSSWPLVTQGQLSRCEAEPTSTNHMDMISIHNTCTNCRHGMVQTHCTFQYQKAPIVLFLFCISFSHSQRSIAHGNTDIPCWEATPLRELGLEVTDHRGGSAWNLTQPTLPLGAHLMGQNQKYLNTWVSWGKHESDGHGSLEGPWKRVLLKSFLPKTN